jgi:hypothetical protein
MPAQRPAKAGVARTAIAGDRLTAVGVPSIAVATLLSGDGWPQPLVATVVRGQPRISGRTAMVIATAPNGGRETITVHVRTHRLRSIRMTNAADTVTVRSTTLAAAPAATRYESSVLTRRPSGSTAGQIPVAGDR